MTFDRSPRKDGSIREDKERREDDPYMLPIVLQIFIVCDGKPEKRGVVAIRCSIATRNLDDAHHARADDDLRQR